MSDSFRPSLWEKQTFLADFDVLIIGSGIVGLSAAIDLKQKAAALNVGIVERGTFPLGASTRNAGFACFGSISELLADIDSMGENEALQLVERRKKGLDKLLLRLKPEQIGYDECGGAEIFLAEDAEKYRLCLQRLHDLNMALHSIFSGDPFVPEKCERFGFRGLAGMISHPFEGHLHPGKMVRALQAMANGLGVRMCMGTTVESLETGTRQVVVRCEKQMAFKAKYVIVATNGYAGTLTPGLDLTPARNQVFVTEEVPALAVRGCFHYNEGYVYFRDVGKRILIGGARHIDIDGEMTAEFGTNAKIREWLRRFLQDHILDRDVQFVHSWSGIMGVGPRKSPIIRMMDTRIAVAVRLGGMGVALGSLAGEEVADLILKQHNAGP